MKPIKLVLSAFGPFAGVQEVNFKELNEKGIFLITGDTGAGKTTIFDAISFALYGEASGGTERRLAKSFRSDYASKNIPTYVEFTFTHKGLTYIIRRNPEYERQKLKGEGFTTESAKASLKVIETMELYDSIELVNNKISDILVLTKSQFNQTVMIAQGDFLKILNAKSDERKKLFQRLFNTGTFARLQEKLKEMNYSLDLELKQINENIKINLAKIQVSEGFSPEIYNYMDSEYNLDKLLPKLSDLVKYEEEKKKSLELLLLNNQNMLISLTKQISNGKIINQNLERYQSLVKEVNELKIKEPEINKLKEDYLLIKNALNLQVFEMELDNCTNEKETFKKVIVDDQNILMETQKKLIILTKEKEKIEKDFSKINELNDLLNKFVVAFNSKKQYDEMNINLLKLQNRISKELSVSKKKDQIYQENKNKFYASQAGLLASTLQDNTPCPVCGSMHHPHKAQLSNEFVSKDDLEKSEIEAKKSIDNLNNLTLELTKLKTNMQALVNDITYAGFPIDSSNKDFEDKIEDLKKQINVIITSYNDIQREYTTNINLIDSKKDAIVTNKEKYQLAIKKEEAAFEKFDKELHNLGFKEISDYYQAKENIKNITKIEQVILQFDKDFSSKNILLLEYAEKTKNTTVVDIKSLEIKKNNIDTSNLVLNKEKDRFSKELSLNHVAYKELYNNKLNKEKIVKKYSIVNDVYRSISGQLSQRVKISFETFIQQYYFKQVIVAANNRLLPLTDGMFTLRCKPLAKNMQSQVGLDLDVFDRNTGLWRDASTLSGGESFLASLALALGLSDVVQSMSGGVRLDSMFIDEGFGSLDEESLNQAINVISSLADGKQTVGIISHVAQIKDRIDNKIIVTKTPCGSKITMEIN